MVLYNMKNTCIESGEIILSKPDMVRKILLDMGISEENIEILVYKDKLNHCLIWLFIIIILLLLFLIVYLI